MNGGEGKRMYMCEREGGRERDRARRRERERERERGEKGEGRVGRLSMSVLRHATFFTGIVNTRALTL